MVAQTKTEPATKPKRKVGPAPLPPIPMPGAEPVVAKVGKTGPEIPLAGVTAEDLALLAEAKRRADARKLDFEDRVRFLQERDKTLAGIIAEKDAADEMVTALVSKLESAMTKAQREEGTSHTELPGVLQVTFPTPRHCFRMAKDLAEVYANPVLRRALGVTIEPTKPPRLKLKLL